MIGSPSYRIIHLTDLHWDASKANDQCIIIEGLNSDLSLLVRERRPDLLVFSGDLVQTGGVRESFDAAKQNFLDRIRDTAALTDSDILICPGNHDVDRTLANGQSYFEKGISQDLQDRAALNTHIDRYIDVSFDKDDSNMRLANFFRFANSHYNKNPIFSTNYVSCIIKNTAIGKIGFAILNTAWRSSGAGEVERHHLLLGERTVDFAARSLKDCDIRIAIFHHPLDWLAPWDRKYSQIPLFQNFNLLLFGHVHESMPTLTENAIGQCLLLQGGALYLHRDYYNGYEVIDLYLNGSLNASLELRTWFNQPRRSFGPAENICDAGRKSFTMGSRTSVGQKLSVSELLALQNATDEFANEHMRLLQLANVGNFDNSFTWPPLSHKTDDELLKSAPTEFRKHLLNLDSVLAATGAILFSGGRESGKTTLALAIAKEIFKGEQSQLRIPILIDFTLLRNYDKLEQVIRRSLSNLDIDISASRILQYHKCVFIVDNVTLANADKVTKLKKLIGDYKKHDWIIFLDHVLLLSARNLIDEFSLSQAPIFILPFGRGEIRSLVSKISSSLVQSESADTVITLIDNNNLPRSPYIVTVLTAVLLNTSVETIFNEASLLEKMIEILLNKHDSASIIRGATDFAGQNIVLEQIALWLAESSGVLHQDALIIRMTEFFKERGIKASAVDLYDKYLAMGLLDRVGDDVTFRYRSIAA
jgi:DNA polymerase III delta prime subunit